MTKLKNIAWGSRRRRVATVVAAFFLTVASTAVAAFIIFSGVGGSGGGQFTSTTSTVAAINVSTTANPTLVPGAGAVAYPLVFTNADSGAAHGIVANTLSATITSSNPSCPDHLTLGGTWNSLVAAGVPSIAASGSNSAAGSGVTISAGGGAPLGCAGATFTVTFSGTSN